MKKTTKILSLALVVVMLFALTACFKQEGTIGAVIDQSEVSDIRISYPISSQFPGYTLDGAKKDAVFTFVLNNQKVTEDEERITEVLESIDAINLVYVEFYTNDGEKIVITANKDTGDFVIGYYTAEGGIDYRYASPEGEGFDIEAIMELVNEVK